MGQLSLVEPIAYAHPNRHRYDAKRPSFPREASAAPPVAFQPLFFVLLLVFHFKNVYLARNWNRIELRECSR